VVGCSVGVVIAGEGLCVRLRWWCVQFVPASSMEVGRSNGVIGVDCHQSVFGIADGRGHLDRSGRSETFFSLADATILPRVWANKVGQME
jgi:hypothetical protein